MGYQLKHFESFFISSQGDEQKGAMGAIVAVLEGPFQATRLQESLDRAISQHPALRAQLHRASNPKGKVFQQWNILEGVSVPLRIGTQKKIDPCFAPSLFEKPIDVTQECPIRVSLFQVDSDPKDRKHLLRLDFHAALCDTPAAILFFEDAMSAYAFEHGAERSPDLTAFGGRLITGANSFHGVEVIGWLFRALGTLLGNWLRRLWSGASVRQGKLSYQESDGPQAAKRDELRLFKLTPAQSDMFGVVGRRGGGHAIHGILRDIALALEDMSQGGNLAWSHDILVEQNQRQPGDAARLPEANLSGLSWVRVKPQAGLDRLVFLRGIVMHLSYAAARVLSHRDLLVLRSLKRFFARFSSSNRRKIPWPVIFCDGGVPFATSFLPRDADGTVVLRGIRIESLAMAPPLWGIAGCSIGVMHYRNALHFAVHAGSGFGSHQDLAGLMERLAERCYQTAAEPRREHLALEALLEVHARLTLGTGPLRSLPIGKHVSPDASALKNSRTAGTLTSSQVTEQSLTEGGLQGRVPVSPADKLPSYSP